MQMPQRQLAAALDIDTATYCKIERGERKARKEQVVLLSDIFNVAPESLLSLWLADKVVEVALTERKLASDVLTLAACNIKNYSC